MRRPSPYFLRVYLNQLTCIMDAHRFSDEYSTDQEEQQLLSNDDGDITQQASQRQAAGVPP